MIEAMGEGVDTALKGFEAGREVFDAVELVSPRALGAFDVAVELGPLRRQDEEAQVALSALPPRTRPELRPAIDLDALDAEGDLGDELVEEGCGAARGCAAGDEGDGPLRAESPRERARRQRSSASRLTAAICEVCAVRRDDSEAPR